MKIWQERQKQVDEWFIRPENEGATMDECPLIANYKYLDGDSVYNTSRFRCTWVRTGETVILNIEQMGQGVPYYKVIAVSEEVE